MQLRMMWFISTAVIVVLFLARVITEASKIGWTEPVSGQTNMIGVAVLTWCLSGFYLIVLDLLQKRRDAR